MIYFECKVRYEKQLANGKIKDVTEAYLVDAMTFTEAETRFIAYITPFVKGEFEVVAIKKVRYAEYFKSEDKEADMYYNCRAEYATVDERGFEKKTPQLILVKSVDIDDAMETLHANMKDTISDYEIISVKDNKVICIV